MSVIGESSYLYRRRRRLRPRPFFRNSFFTPYSAAADTEPSASALAPRFIDDLAKTLLINGFSNPTTALPHPCPVCRFETRLIVGVVVVSIVVVLLLPTQASVQHDVSMHVVVVGVVS